MAGKREEWTATQGGEEVRDQNGDRVADVYATRDAEYTETSLRISAVPDYEAALRAVLEREAGSDLRFTLGTGILEDIRAALRKGGRLP